jgi:AhpD family alkylhydroperoxidase
VASAGVCEVDGDLIFCHKLINLQHIDYIKYFRRLIMSKSFKEITQDIKQLLIPFRKEAKEPMAGFDAMAKAAMAPGVLSELQKELIATSIAVGSHCDGCIGFHVKSLVRLGATREQVNEMLAVAVYMGGGPSLMYAAEVLRAFEEFQA